MTEFPARTRVGRRHSEASSNSWRQALIKGLSPVSDTLVEWARRTAADEGAHAEDDVRLDMARVHAEIDRILARARSEGAEAAKWIAALQLAAARRQAREMVLGVRQRTYQTLRREAIEALVARASTTEGQMLVDRLSAGVSERLGGDVHINRSGPGALVVEAESESGLRRAAIGPAALVDYVLSSMTEEVEELWT